MSTQAASTETYREKAARKFKQQPLVPLGAAATTVALIVAMTKMRKGQQHSFNNWLRVRILAQGLTVAAIVGGSWAYGTGTASVSQREADDAATAEKVQVDRAAFEGRMRVAEEIHRAESGEPPLPPLAVKAPVQGGAGAQGEVRAAPAPAGEAKSWWSWSSWTGSGKSGKGSDKPS